MKNDNKKGTPLLLLLLWSGAALACSYFIKSEWAVPIVFFVIAYQLGLLPDKLFSLIKTGKADVNVGSSRGENSRSSNQGESADRQTHLFHLPKRETGIEKKTRERIQQILPGFKFESEKKLETSGKISIRPDGFFQKNGIHFLLEIKQGTPNDSHLNFFDRYINFYQGTKREAFFYLAFAFEGKQDTPQTKEIRAKFEKEFEEHYRNYNAFLIWVDLSSSPSEKKPSK